MRNNLIGNQIVIGDGIFQAVVGGRDTSFTTKQAESGFTHHVDRRGRQANLERIKILKQVAVDVVDRAVGFIGDDQIEITDIKMVHDFHHAGISGNVDPGVLPVCFFRFPDHIQRLIGELIEGIRCLFAQLFTVAKEQNSFYPTGINHQFA